MNGKAMTSKLFIVNNGAAESWYKFCPEARRTTL